MCVCVNIYISCKGTEVQLHRLLTHSIFHIHTEYPVSRTQKRKQACLSLK